MSNRLTLRQLRYFVAVAGELNFRRASEKLGVSQPPLSRQIQELEDIVGVRLLERDTQRVALTAAGMDFLEDARRLLAQAEQLVENTRSRHGKPSMAIAASPTLTALQVASMRRVFDKLLGEGRYVLTAGVRSPEIAQDLREGKLAAALVSLPVDLGACQHEPMLVDELVAALPSAHPAARHRRVSLAQLQGLPLFWWPRNYNPAYYDLLKQVLIERGNKPRIINVESAQLLTLERIANGDGYTLINQSRDHHRIRGLVYRPLADGDALSIRVVWAWNEHLDDALGRRLAKALRERLT